MSGVALWLWVAMVAAAPSSGPPWVAVGGVTGGGVGDVAGGGVGGCPVCRLLAAAAADEVAVVEGAVVVAQLRLPPVELPQPEPGWAGVVLGRVHEGEEEESPPPPSP